MRRMNFKAPYATLMPPQGRAMYRQGGILFDGHGAEVGQAEGVEVPADPADTQKAISDENAELKARLAEMEKRMAEMAKAPQQPAPAPTKPEPPADAPKETLAPQQPAPAQNAPTKPGTAKKAGS